MSKNLSKSHCTNGLLAKQNVQLSSSLLITALHLTALLCALNYFEDLKLAPRNSADVCTCKTTGLFASDGLAWVTARDFVVVNCCIDLSVID